jgi:hypothetical protein
MHQEGPEKDLLRFVGENQIRVLNVAGPRASTEPEIAACVLHALDRAFASQ